MGKVLVKSIFLTNTIDKNGNLFTEECIKKASEDWNNRKSSLMTPEQKKIEEFEGIEEMSQKQFEEIASCVGKTIKEVHAGSYADYLIILFEDNTYTFIEPAHVYEDLILETRKLDIVECADKDLIELGIFSQEEADEHIAKIDAEQAKKMEDRERQMLTYLKGKYENGLGS